MSPSPIERLIDKVSMRCMVCEAPAGTCGCWTECPCGHSYRTGETCHNPKHAMDEAADAFADSVAEAVIGQMRVTYPSQIAHASGGFRKTLSAAIKREVRDIVSAIYDACEEAQAIEAMRPDYIRHPERNGRE